MIVVKKMKKTMLSIGLAIILGSGLSLFSLYYLSKEKTETQKEVTAFQIGVYQKRENAQKACESHLGSIIIEDQGVYRVYIAVALGEEWQEQMEKYYESKQIDYVTKKVAVTNDFYEELNKFEQVLLKTKEKIYPQVNQELMQKLKGAVV